MAITVVIEFMETSQPIIHENVINAYTKGRLYCVYLGSGTVYKYPIEHLFRVKEDYAPHAPAITYSANVTGTTIFPDGVQFTPTVGGHISEEE